MQAKASTNFIRVSPRRARNVADLIRGLPVSQALGVVRFTPTRAAGLIGKTLQSAIANAKVKKVEDVDAMRVAKITIDGGPLIKRFRARAMGRANRILKRTAHISIVLNEVEKKAEPKKQDKTKAKAEKKAK